MDECRICGSTDIQFDKELQSIISDKLLRYFICNHCGTIMESADDTPKYEEESLFNSPSSIKYYVETGAGLFFIALQIQLIKNILERKFSSVPVNMKYLDVGTGFGFSIYLAQQLGLDAVGVEPSGMGKIGSEMLGIKSIIPGYLENSNLPESSFDIIVSSEVIEHVREPDIFVQNLHKYLAPEGFILLTTPNADVAFPGQNVEEEWLAEYAPGLHLNIFSPHSISLLLNRNGFEDVKIFFSEGSSGKKRMILVAAREKGTLPDNLDWNEVPASTKTLLKNSLRNLVATKEANNQQDDVYSGALYRLVDLLVNAGDYQESQKYAGQIDRIIQSTGFNQDSLLSIRANSFEEYVKQVPAYIGYYYFYKGMICLNHTKNYQEAINNFQLASYLCKLQGDIGYLGGIKWHFQAKIHEGIALLYSGNRTAAIQLFNDLLKQVDVIPKDIIDSLYWSKGIAHLQSRENNQALQSFQELLVNCPEYPQAALQIITALNQSIEDLQNTVTDLQKTVKNLQKQIKS